MCGRMTMTHPSDAMARLFDSVPSNDLPEGPRYNICPTQSLAVATSEDGQRRLRPMRWGFLPHWYKSTRDGPLLINARGETIAEKPAFRKAVRTRRCLVPASGFYEWTKDQDGNRLPWYFSPAAQEPLVLAGIWQDWERGEERYTTCAIVTCAAGPWMAEIHHREPVRIEPADFALWLGEGGHGAASLMQAAPDDYYVRHRVDPAVNSNRAQGPELVAPL